MEIYIIESKSEEVVEEGLFVDTKEQLEELEEWIKENYPYPEYITFYGGSIEEEEYEEEWEETSTEIKVEDYFLIPQTRSGTTYMHSVALIREGERWYEIVNADYYYNNNSGDVWEIDFEDLTYIGNGKDAWMHYKACFYDPDEMDYDEEDFL